MRENGELSSGIEPVHGKGKPNVRVVGEIEAPRHDADNPEDPLVERDVLLKHRSAATETTLPQAIADKSNTASQTLALFLRQEVAAEDGLDLKGGGPALGPVDHADSFGLCAASQGQAIAREGNHAVEG